MRNWHILLLLLLNQVGGEVLHVNKSALDVGGSVTSTASSSSLSVPKTLLRETIELLQVETITNLQKEIQDLKEERDQNEIQKKVLQQRDSKQATLIEKLQRETIEESSRLRKEYEDNLQQVIKEHENNKTRIIQENENNIQKINQQNMINEKVLNKKLSGKTILISYMMSVLKKSEEMMQTRQDIIEAQANEMKEKLDKYEECQSRTIDLLKIISESNETIHKQADNMARLQNIIKIDKNLTRLYDKIEKNDPSKNNCDLTTWMKSLTEAYAEQQEKISALTLFLEGNVSIEDSLKSIETDILKIRQTDKAEKRTMITKYQELVQKQSKSILMLRKLISYTVNSTSALRYQKDEEGTLLSAITCACIPDPPHGSGLRPAKITYECTESRNKSYDLNCVEGTCTIIEWPECEEEITEDESNDEPSTRDHEEATWKFVNCDKVYIAYLNKSVNCGIGGSTVGLWKTRVGQGVFNQEVSVPCIECEEEVFEWSPWSTVQNRSVRSRGSSTVANSYQEEERPVCKEGWTPYENACYKLFNGRTTTDSYRSVCQDVHNLGENDFLTTLLSDSPRAYLTWIGGYGCTSKGTGCKWLDGSEWDWENWERPKGNFGPRWCVFMGYNERSYEQNLWFDGACDRTLRSEVDGICKINSS
eukprot:GFUD01110919.1.p1 GENE.GFUD01110919.1~~GFUD01110919.1.p1  ORF type:complete len:650 (-),score=161.53 GFUD01110919.1:50-1999(-)